MKRSDFFCFLKRFFIMAKRQFSKVECKHGAPMGRADNGTVAECLPRTVRLYRVNLDAQGYDDGGAYWGLSGNVWGVASSLWCAEGDSGNGEIYRQFTRAKSRESAIVALNIKSGLLIQGPKKANLATIKKLTINGWLTESSLHDSLIDLGYYD